MRRNKRNGQLDEGVYNIEHTVHSDELFVIRQHKRNGQPDQGVCDIQITRMNCLRWDKRTEMVQLNKMCVIRGIQVCNRKRVRRPITTQMITANKPCVLWANDCWHTIVSGWWKHHRRVPLCSPCAMWFSLSTQHLHSVYRASTYILKKTALHNQIKHTITQVTTHITFPHTKVSNYMHTKVVEWRI